MLEARLWKVPRRKGISWYRHSKYFSFPQQIFNLVNYLLSRCTCTTSTPSTPSSSSSASSSTSLSSSSLSSWLTGPLPLLRNVSKIICKVSQLQLPWIWVWGVEILQPSTWGEKVFDFAPFFVVNFPDLRYLEFNPMCEVFPRVASCDYKRYTNHLLPHDVIETCLLRSENLVAL